MYIDEDDDEDEAPAFQEMEITWRRALSVWWVLVWRTAAMAAVVGIVVSMGWSIFATPNDYTPALAAAIAMPLGLVAVRMALAKPYRGFRLVAVPEDAAPILRKPARKTAAAAPSARARPAG